MSRVGIPTTEIAMLTGSWRLETFMVLSPDGSKAEPLGDRPRGMITYGADGSMSVHLVKCSATSGAGVMQAYTAYFGSYTVDLDRAVITHHIEGATPDSLAGTQQQRVFELEDDLLVLTTAGSSGMAELRWRRFKPATTGNGSQAIEMME
jgi:hypothetical protein